MYNERKRVLTGQTTENDVVIIKDLQKVRTPICPAPLLLASFVPSRRVWVKL